MPVRGRDTAGLSYKSDALKDVPARPLQRGEALCGFVSPTCFGAALLLPHICSSLHNRTASWPGSTSLLSSCNQGDCIAAPLRVLPGALPARHECLTYARSPTLCKVVLKLLGTWDNPFSVPIELVSKAVAGNECEKWKPAGKQRAAVGTPPPLARRKGKQTHADTTTRFSCFHVIVLLLTKAFLLSPLTRHCARHHARHHFLQPSLLHGELRASLTASSWPGPLSASCLLLRPTEVLSSPLSFSPWVWRHPPAAQPGAVVLPPSASSVCLCLSVFPLSVAGGDL